METETIEVWTLIPEPDRDFLAVSGYEVAVLPGGDNIHVVFKAVKFPASYSAQQADVRIVLPSGYPNAAVDMFRTHPIITLANGELPVGGGGREEFASKTWQVWSRHIQWRTGIDDLRSFVRAIEKEIEKGI
ncbi:MAG: E2/UBC family protein [Puia sp.]|nr:E2/UBC family protein [Puia sp.]